MPSPPKILQRILSGTADANIPFEDVVHLLTELGFKLRVKGSHHIFTKEGLVDRINIQREGNKAKPYQIKQVRRVLLGNPDLR
jgi:predicted RNA binding protein YcfA (HicA-like mRNA interferase family)